MSPVDESENRWPVASRDRIDASDCRRTPAPAGVVGPSHPSPPAITVLLASFAIFSPWETAATRVAKQQAHISRAERLNEGIHQGRVVRRASRELVHLRFVNLTHAALQSRLKIRCYGLARSAAILGSGITKVRLDERDPLAPNASIKVVVPIADMSERSHQVSCAVVYAA